tara:strand:- start:196 stop:1380 length:1185 start_codon:yes stop_codon:yes gene_type:complete
MNYKIFHPSNEVNCEIELPSSKSISNRVLIIRALSKKKFKIDNLSDSDDTNSLKINLKKSENIIDIGASGTTFRFLTAYLASKEGVDCIITGSDRIQNRPINQLVNTLNDLGADISYVKKNNFAPLRIRGKKINGGDATINGNISSQFISSLILIAPILKCGLNLKIKKEIVSKPYIDMTLSLLNYFGVEYEWKKNIISIKPQNYIAKDISIESDWSSAAFWLQIAYLSKNCKIKLKKLNENSIQGDKEVLNIFERLNIKSELKNNILTITKNNTKHKFPKKINLIDTPDLYQSIKCCLFSQNIECKISGLNTLNKKETNRIKSVDTELQNLITNKKIKTYNDHRMAMSFSPMSLKFGEIEILNGDVVTKSYPKFWEDMKKAGFIITSLNQVTT